MARKGNQKQRRVARPVPPPLPPETRTVGQLVAESIRLYGASFWRSLALGAPVAAVGIALAEVPRGARLPLALTAGALAASFSYAAGVYLVDDRRIEWRTLLRATLVGVVAVEPAVLLIAFLNVLGLLPAAAWLGLVGLVVPVVILERRVSFRRALELSRADLAHAIGSLATLTLVALLTAYTIFFTLRSAGTAALRASAFMSVLVISPLLFLGGALLYFDQAARVGSAPRPRRRDADVHPAVHPDRAGRPDAEGEPRPAARGQP
jgi:hypothetical protein